MTEVVYKKIYLVDAACQTEPPEDAQVNNLVDIRMKRIAKNAFFALGVIALTAGLVTSGGTALGYMAVSPWLSEMLVVNGLIVVLSKFFAAKGSMTPFNFKLGMFGLPSCSVSFGMSSLNLK